MKTGKPTRLSEKLNAELDTIRQDYAALMVSQLESFRTDLNSIATNAQRTIEIDTRTFLQQNKSWLETRTWEIKTWLTISPWLITGIIVMGIAPMMAASLLWTQMLASSELTELGLTRIDREDGTWLVLDPTKTRLWTCTLSGRSVTCIKIEEDLMTTPLTALERDLLACVERLVTACETSARELNGLEARSTG